MLFLWFVPVLQTGAITFAPGSFGFAIGIVRSRVLGRLPTRVVVGGLVVRTNKGSNKGSRAGGCGRRSAIPPPMRAQIRAHERLAGPVASSLRRHPKCRLGESADTDGGGRRGGRDRNGTNDVAAPGMQRITTLVSARRWGRVASVLAALVLATCQNNPGGGGSGPGY